MTAEQRVLTKFPNSGTPSLWWGTILGIAGCLVACLASTIRGQWLPSSRYLQTLPKFHWGGVKITQIENHCYRRMLEKKT